jgi:hypothetical protein
MTVMAWSKPSVDLPVGGVWLIDVVVFDVDGEHTDDAPVVTVTLPGGGTASPSVSDLGWGHFRAAYVVGSVGRYVARAVTSVNGAADFTAFVTATVAATGMPGLIDLRGDPDADPPTVGYLGAGSATDDQIQDALDAEAAAQRRVCRVPADYPADLRQALLRRVARNLAMRGQPFLTVPGDDGAISVTPSRDPEVRRLEGPYRKLVMG